MPTLLILKALGQIYFIQNMITLRHCFLYVKVSVNLKMHKISSFPAALAEILSVKEVSGRKLYYVHYIDCEYSLISLNSFNLYIVKVH